MLKIENKILAKTNARLSLQLAFSKLKNNYLSVCTNPNSSISNINIK